MTGYGFSRREEQKTRYDLSAINRALPAAVVPSITPSGEITPARYISAIASIMPDPQIPTTLNLSTVFEPRLVRPEIRPNNAESNIQRDPVDAYAFDCTWRGTHAAADLCAFECRPVGLEHANNPCLLPITISAFVPMSTMSEISSRRCGSSARITAAVSAPTCPAMQGNT